MAHDVVKGHEGIFGEVGVAERAVEIASTEPDEDSRLSRVAAFALQAVEDLVDSILLQVMIIVIFFFLILFAFVIVFFIPCDVVVAFLYDSFIAVGNFVDDPPCDVLGCGIKGQHLVDVLVVEPSVDELFDVSKVSHHAVFVEFSCFAVDGDVPVVTMHLCAFTAIVEFEVMAG